MIFGKLQTYRFAFVLLLYSKMALSNLQSAAHSPQRYPVLTHWPLGDLNVILKI